MTTARIIEADRKTTQSGKAKSGRWVLEFERVAPMRADPLTGWSGSGDTRTQVRLAFDSQEEAIAYAARNGFETHSIPASKPTLKLQTYADNFH